MALRPLCPLPVPSSSKRQRFPALVLVAGLGLSAGGPVPRVGAQGNVEAPAAAPRTLRLPFEYDALTMPYVMVKATLNGQEVGPLLVDTGTRVPLVIDSHAAAKVGLMPNGNKIPLNPGSAPADAATVEALAFGPKVGGFRFSKIPAALSDLSRMALGGPPVAGIIGLPLMGATRATFDFEARNLEMILNAPPLAEDPDAVDLPLHTVAADNSRVYVRAGAPPNDADMVLLLDTGSALTLVRPSTVAGVEVRGRATLVRNALGSFSIGEEILAPELKLGSHSVRDLPLNICNETEMQRIGTDVLSRFLVTLDVKAGRLRLKPLKGSAPRKAGGFSGIWLDKRGESLVAALIYPQGPASRGGVRPDDRVVSIDGRSVAELARSAAQRLLDGFEGGETTLVLAGEGAPRTVRFIRASRYSAPQIPLLGATFLTPPGMPFIVRSVRPGSPAEKGGLKADDQLLSLNGIETATFPPARLGLELRRPRIAVKVRRGDMDVSDELVFTAVKP